MTSCPRLGKLFNGCRFKPRYDLGAGHTNFKIGAEFAVAAIEATKPKTYIHDICETCGTTVKRP